MQLLAMKTNVKKMFVMRDRLAALICASLLASDSADISSQVLRLHFIERHCFLQTLSYSHSVQYRNLNWKREKFIIKS